MNILFRYICATFMKLFVICVTCFLVVYLAIDFMSMFWRLSSRGVPTLHVWSYFFFKIPFILLQITPMATLLSTMLTLGILSRNSEITVIKACGISIFALSMPVLLLSLGIGLFSLATAEYMVPYSNKRYKEIEQFRPGLNHSQWLFKRSKIWYFGGNNIFNVDSLDVEKKNLRGLTVFQVGKDYRIEKRIDADKAHFDGKEWILIRGISREFKNSLKVETFDKQRFHFNEHFDDFIVKMASSLPDEMTFGELNQHIEKLKKMGLSYSHFFVDLMAKIAFPLANLILPLIGIPFALKSGRSAGIAAGVGISIVIGFAYWIVMAFNISLGHAGILTPFIAAFGANIIFGLGGLLMILNTET